MKLEEFLNCKHDIEANTSMTRLYCIKCGQDANVIDLVKKLLLFKNEAIQVLNFYATDENWCENNYRNNLYNIIGGDDCNDFDDSGLRHGGRRAREFKNKMQEILK